MAKSRNKGFNIRLGRLEWIRHTYQREPGDDLELIGSICRGPQLGALGRMTSTGEYFQIVGDHLTLLNQSKIERLLEKANKLHGRTYFHPSEPP